MAFPTFVAAPTETQTTLSGAIPVSINVPSATSGNKLIAIIASNIAWAGFTAPSGWAIKRALIHTSLNSELLILERTATGSDSLSIQWNTTSNAVAFVVEVQDAATDTLDVSTGAEGSSTGPDPDAVTPSGGSGDYLVIAVALEDRGSGNAFTGFPYADNNYQQHSGGAGGNHVTQAICSDELNGSSFDPGAFTCSNWPWLALALTVAPAAATDIFFGASGAHRIGRPRMVSSGTM